MFHVRVWPPWICDVIDALEWVARNHETYKIRIVNISLGHAVLESIFTDPARQEVLRGATWLVNVTNDEWFGRSAALTQHAAMAVFRAVETGRPLLRVTNTGLTARIDGRGRVLDAAGKNRQEVRTWPVARTDDEKTFYVKWGDGFVAVCSLVSLALLLLTYVPTRRRRPARARRR